MDKEWAGSLKWSAVWPAGTYLQHRRYKEKTINIAFSHELDVAAFVGLFPPTAEFVYNFKECQRVIRQISLKVRSKQVAYNVSYSFPVLELSLDFQMTSLPAKTEVMEHNSII